jgi:hypothetical protein
MLSSGICCRVALVGTDVTTNSSETYVLARATERHVLEDGILHSHYSEMLKSYIALTGWTL